MPRIRKKTSKRVSTHQRAKFKHKVAEGRKKNKKLAKKNPQWKSKKPKDPGIPNDFPYKDQILAEVAETRRQAEETKQRLKEEKKAARLGLPIPGADGEVVLDDEPIEEGSSSKTVLEKDPPLLFNPDLPNMKAVLDKADVVLHILDARDPLSHRLSHIEDLVFANQKSKLVFVLNKIDLVPREALGAWAKQLRTQHSTFLFRSASSFLPKTPTNDPKAKGKAKESPLDAIGSDVLLEYLGQWADVIQSETLQVAVVGLTNSGKSALVNSLARRAVVPVYAPTSSTDAWATTTTRAYEVSVEVAGHKINLVDTPGVSLQNEQEHDEALKTRDMLLRCRGRVDKVKDPVPAAEHIVSRAGNEDLMLQYNLPAFTKGDCAAFLSGVSRSNALLKKGGNPDLTYAARIVLRDWTTGKFPFYTEPPTQASAGVVENDPLVERGDEVALAAVRPRREMRKQGGLVRLAPGEIEGRKVLLETPFVLEDAESESGDGDKDEAVDVDVDGEEEDEDEEDEDEDEDEDKEAEEDVATPPLTGKRKRKAAAAAAPPAKKVAFAAGTQDRHEGRRAAKFPAKKAASAKPPAKKAASAKPLAKKATSAKSKPSTGSDAYDFDQFFKK